MKKKLKIKSFLFYWFFSNILLTATSTRDIKFELFSPGRLVLKRELNLSLFKTGLDMKDHIKKALNIHRENSTLDRYVSSIFNLSNNNPTYVFLLPDKQKLIFRKSDFSKPVFPNITNVNKFAKSTDKLQMQSSAKHQVKQLADEYKNNFDSNDDYDEIVKEIIDENVKSEKNFIQFMNELNNDLNDQPHYQRQTSPRPAKFVSKKRPKQKLKSGKDEWEELGLSGWSGDIAGSKSELPKRQKSISPEKTSSVFENDYYAFEFNKQQPVASSPKKNNRKPSGKDIEQDELSSILLKEDQILLNKTGRHQDQTPQWPITTTRDKHGDNDVFLARANNPFGHSTKWKYSNSSTNGEPHRESRSKRGVLHLYSMIKCATGCDPIMYKGYGCYCGFLGSGLALDGIDRCCKMHDLCYTQSNCFFYTEYFVPYLWTCFRGKPLCAIDNGEWGGPGSCATRLCLCDLSLSKCLRRHYCPKKRPVCLSSPFRILQNLVMVF